jgi:hypothetical protein
MDFTWVTDAAGDIQGVTVTSPLTGGGTIGTVTVGILSGTTSNLGAVQLSDSTSSTSTTLAATANAVKTTYDLANSAYAPAFTNNYYAGKNKAMNGDFSIWQRGTSFSTEGYTADRWRFSKNGGTTATISRQTFTPGAAPAAPYESQYFARYQRTAGAFDDYLVQRVEDVRTLAGTSSRLSFWAKAASTTTISQVYLAQTTNGSGGGAAGNFSGLAITTSWVRYSIDVSLASLSGATIGANNYVEIVFKFGSEMGNVTVDLWGVQWEAGSTATPFQTASGTIQGELALCQRYCQMYQPATGNQDYLVFGGTCDSSSYARYPFVFPVVMRVAPTLTTNGTANDYANLNASGRQLATSTPTLESARNFSASISCFSGGLSTGQATSFRSGLNAGYLLFTAEL